MNPRLTAVLFVVAALPGTTAVAGPPGDAPTDATTKLLQTFAEEFVPITPGDGKFPATCRIGSADGDMAADASERPARTIRMGKPFAIARYEVPQNLYAAVMGKNPSRWTGPRNSVEMVSFQDAQAFCVRATELLREAGLIESTQAVRLPTEAEWEYCCRAGTETAYSFGESATRPGDDGVKASALDEYAWHTGNAAGNDPPVGALKPNAWGLYDMHGYLWEFAADAWHPNHEGRPEVASARASERPQTLRVIRGGSWRDRHELLRSAVRWPIPDHAASDAIGFRCVLAGVTGDLPADEEKEPK
jgi:formylglycine-generating enzyme required for sulfatase activity